MQSSQYGPTVLSMYVSAYRVRSWKEVELRVQNHPTEARQRDLYHRSVLEIVLSRRMEDTPPPISTVQVIIHAHPIAVWSGTFYSDPLWTTRFPLHCSFPSNTAKDTADTFGTPLEIAARRRVPFLVLQSLTNQRPSFPSDARAILALWYSYRDFLFPRPSQLLQEPLDHHQPLVSRSSTDMPQPSTSRNTLFRDILLGTLVQECQMDDESGSPVEHSIGTIPTSVRETATIVSRLAHLIRYVQDHHDTRLRTFTGLHSVVAIPIHSDWFMSSSKTPINSTTTKNFHRPTQTRENQRIGTISCDPSLLEWLISIFPEQLSQPSSSVVSSSHFTSSSHGEKLGCTNDGRLPLHCLVAYPTTRVSFPHCLIVSAITSNNVDRWNSRQDTANDAPAAAPNDTNMSEICDIIVCPRHRRQRNLDLLLIAYPIAIRVTDNHNDLPLHLAIRAQVWNDNCFCHQHTKVSENHSLEALQIPIDCCDNLHAFDTLLQAYPEAVSIPDGKYGLFPFLLAGMRTNGNQDDIQPETASQASKTVSVIYTLLRSDPRLLDIQRGFCNSLRRFDKSHSAHPDVVDHDIDNDDGEPTHELLLVLDRAENEMKHNPSLWQSLNEALWRKFIPRYRMKVDDDDDDDSQFLFVHALAGLPRCPKELLQLFVAFHPSSLYDCDCQGRHPLHRLAMIGSRRNDDVPASWEMRIMDCLDHVECDGCIMEGTDEQRLRYLLKMNPSAIQTMDHDCFLPLHLGAIYGLSLSCVRILVAAWPDALRQQHDHSLLFPVFLAATSEESSLDHVFYLLQAAPDILHRCRRPNT
jgi:hypothetical protein